MGRKLIDPELTRTKFYYVRTKDASNFPVITVCLKHSVPAGKISRGIAVCSMELEDEQKRTKKAGRGIAETRARYALVKECKHLAISESAMDNMHYEAYKFFAGNNILYMCDNDPILTDHERKILHLEIPDYPYRVPVLDDDDLKTNHRQYNQWKSSHPAILPMDDTIFERIKGWLKKLGK